MSCKLEGLTGHPALPTGVISYRQDIEQKNKNILTGMTGSLSRDLLNYVSSWWLVIVERHTPEEWGRSREAHNRPADERRSFRPSSVKQEVSSRMQRVVERSAQGLQNWSPKYPECDEVRMSSILTRGWDRPPRDWRYEAQRARRRPTDREHEYSS
jgi:hypothetical protein